jgi:hypothetical protein
MIAKPAMVRTCAGANVAKIIVPFLEPVRPSGMCAEQRTDYLAACDGRITWRQYFAKWGDPHPSP